MKNRREIIAAGFPSLALAATRSSAAVSVASIKTIYKCDLPPVSLDSWEATVVELTFPPGIISPKHFHPSFVLGYVLEGKFRFQIEGETEREISTGEVFFAPLGAIHLPSVSSSATKPARVLALAFGEKGKELTKRL